MENFAARWIYVALIYFVVAVGLGVFMGASHDHSLLSVHAHLNLLGWVSQALTGFIYHHFAVAGRSKLATAHFWLYNLALGPMMLSLGMMIKGNEAMEPAGGILSALMGLSILLFAFNLFMSTATAPRTAVQAA